MEQGDRQKQVLLIEAGCATLWDTEAWGPHHAGGFRHRLQPKVMRSRWRWNSKFQGLEVVETGKVGYFPMMTCAMHRALLAHKETKSREYMSLKDVAGSRNFREADWTLRQWHVILTDWLEEFDKVAGGHLVSYHPSTQWDREGLEVERAQVWHWLNTFYKTAAQMHCGSGETCTLHADGGDSVYEGLMPLWVMLSEGQALAWSIFMSMFTLTCIAEVLGDEEMEQSLHRVIGRCFNGLRRCVESRETKETEEIGGFRVDVRGFFVQYSPLYEKLAKGVVMDEDDSGSDTE